MSESLSQPDQLVVATLGRVRGGRAATLRRFSQLIAERSDEALRKRLERLCDLGILAASALPRGSRLFRLSKKGVPLAGAPPSYANSPSTSVAAEMIAVSSLAWRTDEFLFPTKAEAEALLDEPSTSACRPKFSFRFVLRPMKTREGESELHLHVFLAELRPADELARRVEVSLQQARRSPLLAGLIQVGLFGVTVAVPSPGVKASLEARILSVETSVIVVEDLKDLIAH